MHVLCLRKHSCGVPARPQVAIEGIQRVHLPAAERPVHNAGILLNALRVRALGNDDVAFLQGPPQQDLRGLNVVRSGSGNNGGCSHEFRGSPGEAAVRFHLDAVLSARVHCVALLEHGVDLELVDNGDDSAPLSRAQLIEMMAHVV